MKHLSKNLLSLLASDLFRRLLGFITVAVLARRVGTDYFGMINIAFTVLSYAILASSTGLVLYGVREIAQGAGTDLVNRIISCRLFFSSVAFIFILAVAQLAVINEMTKILVCLLCLSVFSNSVFLDWYFQGKEKMIIVDSTRVLSAAVYMIIILVFVRSKSDVLWVAVAALISDAVAAFIFLKYYKIECGGLYLRFEPIEWKSLFRKSIPLSAGSIFGNLSLNIAPLLIGIILSNVQVGIFSAASRLTFFLLMLDRIFGSLILPASARLLNESAEKMRETLSIASKWIVTTALPLALGGTIIAKQMISYIFGAQYIAAAQVFQVLIWYFFVTVLHTVFMSGLIAIGQEKFYGRIMMLSFLIYLVTISIGTCLFSETGAAVGVVVSEILTMLIMQYKMRVFMNIPIVKYIFKVLPAVMAMAVTLIILPPYHMLILIAAGGIVYFIIAFLTRAITMIELKGLLRYL